MKKKKKLIIIIAAVVILAIIAFAIIGKTRGGEGSEETTTSTAQIMTIEKTISSDGEITSTLEENLEPHTSYYLKKIVATEGDAVAEGDTILAYTNGYKMTAPYDCVVESWYLPDVGDQLTSDHYITVAGTDVLQLEVEVGEDEVSFLKEGYTADITVEAISGQYEGEVSYVSQVGEYSGGTSNFTAKVAFDNDGKLKLGMTGNAEIVLDKAEDVIAVPVDAVHITNSMYCVTVVDGNSTEEREVEKGISNDSYIEIKRGLEEGETVIVPVSDEDSSSGFGDMPGGGSIPGGGSPGGSPQGGGSMPGGGSQGGGGIPGGNPPNKQ